LTYGVLTIQEIAEVVQGNQLTRQDYNYLMLSRERIIYDLYHREIQAPAGFAYPLVMVVMNAWPELSNREKIESLLFLCRLRKKMESLNQLESLIGSCSEELKSVFSENDFFVRSDPLYACNICGLMSQPEFAPVVEAFLHNVRANFDSMKPFFNTFLLSSLIKTTIRCIKEKPKYASNSGPVFLEHLTEVIQASLPNSTHSSRLELAALYNKVFDEVRNIACLGPKFLRTRRTLQELVSFKPKGWMPYPERPSDFQE